MSMGGCTRCVDAPDCITVLRHTRDYQYFSVSSSSHRHNFSPSFGSSANGFALPERAQGMKNCPLTSSAAGDVAQYNCVSAPYETEYSIRRYIVSLTPATPREKRKAYSDSNLPPGHVALKIRVDVAWVETRRHDLITMPTRQLSRYHGVALHDPQPIGQQQDEKIIWTRTSLLLLYKIQGSFFLLFGPSTIASKSISFAR